jgi:hypothetical protein
MVTELLVRLKSLFSEISDLIHLAEGAVEWDSMVRISPERAESLADVCDRIRPKLDELSGLLASVAERARQEVKRMR